MFAVRAEIRAGNMEKDKMDEMLTLTIQATTQDILRQKERLGMVNNKYTNRKMRITFFISYCV